MQNVLLFLILMLVSVTAPLAQAQDSVFLEDLTWTEVRDKLQAGTTTVIIPTGGTEQNGPHMILGKHNYRVKFTAGEVARRLGHALVAPVMAYVPEGTIAPPSEHMWAPGTISLPPEQFAKVVESAARSLAAHGFTDIVLIGDSGGNQASLRAVANLLNEEWAAKPVRVLYASAYYKALTSDFATWLQSQGETRDNIGLHAGVADTSLLLAVHPEGVRTNKFAPGRAGDGSGVMGDPRTASAEYGKRGVEMAIAATVRQIQALRIASRKP